jgi:hypothetical protein
VRESASPNPSGLKPKLIRREIKMKASHSKRTSAALKTVSSLGILLFATSVMANDAPSASDRDDRRDDDHHHLPLPGYPGKGGQYAEQKGVIIQPKAGVVVEKAGQKAGQYTQTKGAQHANQKGVIIEPKLGTVSEKVGQKAGQWQGGKPGQKAGEIIKPATSSPIVK